MNTQPAESRYFSYAAAARYIGVSIGTLRRMVERGEVRAYAVGERLIRFDRAELDQLVRANPAEATPKEEIAP